MTTLSAARSYFSRTLLHVFWLSSMVNNIVWAQSDFGDAPASYGTTIAAGGPFHTINPVLRLGLIVDPEANGLPSPANGDDLNGADDEDGVQIYSSTQLRIAGAQIGAWSQLQVGVINEMVTGAFLNAWCDFNADGDFVDPGERIAENITPVNGLNPIAFFTPLTTAPGVSVVRVRLGTMALPVAPLGAGGFGGAGEVEDHPIEFSAPSLATNVQAYDGQGQVWISWQFNVPAAAQVYEVYAANFAFGNISQGRLVARLFPEDYCGRRLVGDLGVIYGAAGRLNFTIPNGAGGMVTLPDNRGLCVETVRPGGLPNRFYAVVPHGMTVIPAASLSPLVPAATYSTAATETPACHLQQSGLVNGYGHQIYAMWGDGDDDPTQGRPDFPLMANTARRGVPHHLLVVTPDPLPAGPRPMTVSLTAGNSEVTTYRPGRILWTAEGSNSPEGISVTMEERIVEIISGRPESHQVNWMGWVPTWNPFENDPPLPSNNAKIQPYGLNRLNWMLDWLKLRSPLMVDPNSIALRGYSAGAAGAMLWGHTFPDQFSHMSLFSPPTHWMHIFPDREAAFGTDAQNLPIEGLINSSGNPLRVLDIKKIPETVPLGVQPPPTKLLFGKRDIWWCKDIEGDLQADLMQDVLAADTADHALGVQFWWDQRQHESEQWTLANAGPVPPGCPAWSGSDFWIPTLSGQTRRDDVFTHHRFKNNRSYPAFHRMQDRRDLHGDPGKVDYGTPPVLYQSLNGREDDIYPGVKDPCTPWLPVVTADRRGTWGGYFDWFTPANTIDSDAQVDTAGEWATSVTLVKDLDAGGLPIPDLDDAPMESLMADVAIRRAQLFLPAIGTKVTWMNVDQDSSRVVQSGITTVPGDGLVRMRDVVVPRMPKKARLIAATQMDFGDAPASYPVTLAENGARHATNSSLFLGTGRTLETEGIHHPNATRAAEGDNGVTGPGTYEAGTVVSINITVSETCRLDAWVDWTRNGQWSGSALDAADPIATSLTLNAGANTLNIFVPLNAVPGLSFARFRVSAGGALEPHGPAPEGEVEDYPLMITTAASGSLNATLTTVNGRARLNWTGNSFWSWQMEHSEDLVQWEPVGIPAQEMSGAMFTTIPDSLTLSPKHFFRIRRSPLVNNPIVAAPGPQLNLSIVQQNGSRVINESTGTRVSSSIARNYHLYVPDHWNPNRTWPVIFMLHGSGMSGASFANTQSELRQIANDRGYITVFPDSTGSEFSSRWFSYPDPTNIDPTNQQPYIDDRAFILNLLDQLMANSGLRVDIGRLYCGGFSNGGSMTHLLASDVRSIWSAFAIMEGGASVVSDYEPRMFFDFHGRFTGPTIPDFPILNARPCILMNMVTSKPFSYEGQPMEDENGNPLDPDGDGDFDTVPSAQENLQCWLTGNALPTLPTTQTRYAFVNDPAWTPTSTDLTLIPSYRNHLARPDTWWDATRKAEYANAYSDLPNPEIPNSLRTPAQELPPSWFQNPANWQALTSYPHLTFSQDHMTYTVAGTWSEAVWPTPAGLTDREVRFITLSEGGHSWPGANDRVGWNGQQRVIDFFDAH